MAKIVKTISLSVQLAEKVDKINNFSALIESLLLKYFEINPEVLEKEITEKKIILEKVKETIQEKDEEIQNEQKKKKNKADERKEKLRTMFLEDIGREITEEELNTFIELVDSELTSYYKYADELKNG